MEVRAAGRTAVDAVVWRHDGALRVTVIAKLTCAFADDAVMERADPQPVFRAEVHHGQNPTRSIRFSGDRVPYLNRGEVLFTGHAYTIAGNAIGMMPVRLGVFDGARALLDKTLLVRHKAGVESLPLVYERAFGGPGWADNPYGTGALEGSGEADVIALEGAKHLAGFAPLGEAWTARRRRLGTTPRRALQGDVIEIPAGFDWAYFQAAPPDQWIDFLRGDEWIVMDGLHPALARVRMRLPGARGVARVYGLSAFGVAEGQPLALHADVLRIDGDEQRCSLTFRGVFPIPDEAALGALRVVAGVESPGDPIPWPDPAVLAAADGDRPMTLSDDDLEPVPGPMYEGTMVLGEGTAQAIAQQTALPFQPEAAPHPIAHGTGAPAPREPSLETVELSGDGAALEALPFHAATEEAPPPTPRQPRPQVPASFEATMALDVSSAGDTPHHALPFGAAAALPPPLPEPMTPAPGAAPAPVVPASRFFHEIARPRDEEVAPPEEPVLELPLRLTDAVPFLFEHDAHKLGPIAGATIAWQLRPPRDSLTVVIKASFDLVNGGPATLRPQADLPSGEVFTANDRQRSLVYPSDFTQYKPRADVILKGHAHAPGGAAPVVDVRLRFGAEGGGAAFERTVRVFGERRWQRHGVSLKPTNPLPLDKIPLTYERAFGGPSFAANPVGVGHRLKGDPVGELLPNLEDPSSPIGSPSDAPPPACFAPIPMTWKERWSKLGTYDDDAWVKDRFPYFAADMDPSFFQAAPASQQLTAVRGDELFEVAGMHPVLPVLRGSLPGQRARCFAQQTAPAGGGFSEVDLRLDTVSFDLDALKIDLVWRGVLEVSDDDAPEVALLFAFLEELAAPTTLAEARARFARARRAAAAPPPERQHAEDPNLAAAREERRLAEEAARAQRQDLRELERRGAEERAKIERTLRERGLSQARIDDLMVEAEREASAPSKAPPVDDLAAQLRRAKLPEEEIAAILAAVARPPAEPPPASADPSARVRVERLLAAGEPLDGLDLAGADLSDLDFTGRSLVRANLLGAKLTRSNLSGADLSQAQLGRADLTEASLDGANLTLCDLFGATVQGARFTGATLSRADLSEAHGERADFHGAKGAGARFARGQWTGARFDESELASADFSGALLDDVSFERAALPDVRLHEARATQATFAGAKMPGARAGESRFARCSFRAAQAPRSGWINAELDGCDFTGAELQGSALLRASCRSTNLSGVDLSEARLDRARLTGALLIKSNLRAASLQHAYLDDADLRGANLYSCNTFRAVFTRARLEGAIVAKSGPGAPGTSAPRPPGGRT